MAGESKLQARIRKWLKRHGWIVVKINLASKPGWPDLYILKNSISIWLEIKDKKEPTALQKHVHQEIRDHGGEAHTVRTWDEFLALDIKKY